MVDVEREIVNLRRQEEEMNPCILIVVNFVWLLQMLLLRVQLRGGRLGSPKVSWHSEASLALVSRDIKLGSTKEAVVLVASSVLMLNL